MITLAFGQGLSSGYIPIGATAFNGRIERAFMTNSDAEGVLTHGYTYTGHPVACAAAIVRAYAQLAGFEVAR